MDYQCLKNHNIADPNGLLYGRVSYCLVISAIKRHWNKLLYIYHTHTSLLNNKLILYTFRMSPSIGQRRMLKSRWGLWLSNWRVWINKLTIWSCDSLPSSRRSVISKYISTWKSNSITNSFDLIESILQVHIMHSSNPLIQTELNKLYFWVGFKV